MSYGPCCGGDLLAGRRVLRVRAFGGPRSLWEQQALPVLPDGFVGLHAGAVVDDSVGGGVDQLTMEMEQAQALMQVNLDLGLAGVSAQADIVRSGREHRSLATCHQLLHVWWPVLGRPVGLGAGGDGRHVVARHPLMGAAVPVATNGVGKGIGP